MAATSTNGCQGSAFSCHFYLSLFLIVYSYSITLTPILPPPFLSGWMRLSRLTLHWGLWLSWIEKIYALWCFCYKCVLIFLFCHNVLIVLSIFVLCFRRLHFWAELSFTRSATTPSVLFSLHCYCIISVTLYFISFHFICCDAKMAINVFIWLLRALVIGVRLFQVNMEWSVWVHVCMLHTWACEPVWPLAKCSGQNWNGRLIS